MTVEGGGNSAPNETLTSAGACRSLLLSLEVLVEHCLNEVLLPSPRGAVGQPLRLWAAVGSQSELPAKVQVCLEPGRQRQLEDPLTQ